MVKESMRRDRPEEDANVNPSQAAIKRGDYLRRNSQYGYPIYGKVFGEEQPCQDRATHYRRCQAYSVAYPSGEMRDVPASKSDELVTKEAFDAARLRGWYP